MIDAFRSLSSDAEHMTASMIYLSVKEVSSL